MHLVLDGLRPGQHRGVVANAELVAPKPARHGARWAIPKEDLHAIAAARVLLLAPARHVVEDTDLPVTADDVLDDAAEEHILMVRPAHELPLQVADVFDNQGVHEVLGEAARDRAQHSDGVLPVMRRRHVPRPHISAQSSSATLGTFKKEDFCFKAEAEAKVQAEAEAEASIIYTIPSAPSFSLHFSFRYGYYSRCSYYSICGTYSVYSRYNKYSRHNRNIADIVDIVDIE